MITAAQCRAARALLRWTLPELAHVSMVSISTINAFELEHRRPIRANLAAMQRAFEGAGVEFLDDTGVRLPTSQRGGEPLPRGGGAADSPGASRRQRTPDGPGA